MPDHLLELAEQFDTLARSLDRLKSFHAPNPVALAQIESAEDRAKRGSPPMRSIFQSS